MEQMQRELEQAGFFVGKRDPNRNKAFRGQFMVCQDTTEGPSDDASTTSYCIVGDNLNALIRDAYDHFAPFHDWENPTGIEYAALKLAEHRRGEDANL
jgi:hypothetical protein